MRWALVAIGIVGCAGPVASSDAATDVGDDAYRAPRDGGADGGFDPAALGTCTLPRPTAFAIPAHDALATSDAIADRDWYVFTALEALPGVEAALAADPTLSGIATARTMALHDADVATCDAACVRAALVRSDDAAAIDATVAALSSATLLDEVAAELRASLRWQRFDGDDDPTLVRRALTEGASTLASALDAYALGELADATRRTVVHDAASMATPAWWQPLLRVTTGAMREGGRDEAVRYEPLRAGENAAAIAAFATTDFSRFPYVAILVPGQGPTDLVTALNPAGAARCDLAVARWQAGLAPFLLLSGGHVHPDRTPFSEAIEMKRYLVATYGVPESAILVDPYARHTTTNLRNAVRELFAYGAPTDGHLLIVTDRFQSAYVLSGGFATRCDDELHLRPFLGLERRTEVDTCMTMAPAAMTFDASDPLDP